MYFRLGDRVKIELPERPKTGVPDLCRPLRQYDGSEAIITSIHSVEDRTGIHYRYYELDGITGRNNIPYAFLDDWLRQII